MTISLPHISEKIGCSQNLLTHSLSHFPQFLSHMCNKFISRARNDRHYRIINKAPKCVIAVYNIKTIPPLDQLFM